MSVWNVCLTRNLYRFTPFYEISCYVSFLRKNIVYFTPYPKWRKVNMQLFLIYIENFFRAFPEQSHSPKTTHLYIDVENWGSSFFFSGWFEGLKYDSMLECLDSHIFLSYNTSKLQPYLILSFSHCVEKYKSCFVWAYAKAFLLIDFPFYTIST